MITEYLVLFNKSESCSARYEKVTAMNKDMFCKFEIVFIIAVILIRNSDGNTQLSRWSNDNSVIDLLPDKITADVVIVTSLIECATFCEQSAACKGFYFTNTTKYCVLAPDLSRKNLKPYSNTRFYHRADANNYQMYRVAYSSADTFADAEQKCNDTNGRLAAPKTAADLVSINRLTIDHGTYWVGAYFNIEKGKFLWTDGTIMSHDPAWLQMASNLEGPVCVFMGASSELTLAPFLCAIGKNILIYPICEY